ncbi:MAG TPA: GDP-mannose 4,6-dehydratase [Bryobacteraceae bacterium]|nr:CDP-paratose 2-epimerase [Bryobacterales bacterium]HRJ19548.1 GDP-mannose 4,6-dehydratase [Bryobacteraceae bacterium]
MTNALITGGAGFIGSNLAARLLRAGHEVRVLDDLSRPGSERNLAWLRSLGGGLRFWQAGINDRQTLAEAATGVAQVYHLAGQVAVTKSVADPRGDFLANALGTLNLLEAVRAKSPDAAVVLASTNKVYGSLAGQRVDLGEGRYRLVDFPLGIPETFPLDFHSPYGCSKGAADQYVRDYHRIYGLRTVVFRQSCIYGPRQFGLSDQGWLAWFVLAALKGMPIQIDGDGCQVRDVLFVEDLLDAYELAAGRVEECAGEVFNIGGGPERVLAIWRDVAPLLERLTGRLPVVQFGPWRPGDQKVFISDTRKVRERLGWWPRVSVEDGVARLVAWTRDEMGAGA